jgi:hypothetical protein
MHGSIPWSGLDCYARILTGNQGWWRRAPTTTRAILGETKTTPHHTAPLGLIASAPALYYLHLARSFPSHFNSGQGILYPSHSLHDGTETADSTSGKPACQPASARQKQGEIDARWNDGAKRFRPRTIATDRPYRAVSTYIPDPHTEQLVS